MRVGVKTPVYMFFIKNTKNQIIKIKQITIFIC